MLVNFMYSSVYVRAVSAYDFACLSLAANMTIYMNSCQGLVLSS